MACVAEKAQTWGQRQGRPDPGVTAAGTAAAVDGTRRGSLLARPSSKSFKSTHMLPRGTLWRGHCHILSLRRKRRPREAERRAHSHTACRRCSLTFLPAACPPRGTDPESSVLLEHSYLSSGRRAGSERLPGEVTRAPAALHIELTAPASQQTRPDRRDRRPARRPGGPGGRGLGRAARLSVDSCLYRLRRVLWEGEPPACGRLCWTSARWQQPLLTGQGPGAPEARGDRVPGPARGSAACHGLDGRPGQCGVRPPWAGTIV